MNEFTQLNTLWSSLNEKLDRNWKLNMHLLQEANLDKAKGKMKQLIWIKGLTLAFYLTAGLLFLAYGIDRIPVISQSLAGFVLSGWSFMIAVTAMKELQAIQSIDFSESVPVVQKKLIELRLTIIRYLKNVVWIFPCYFAFVVLMFDLVIGVDIFAVGDSGWLIMNLIFTLLVAIPAAFWMSGKLTPRNAETKWMNTLLRGNGSQISESMELLKELEEYKK